MKRPYASNEAVKKASRGPRFFHGYELSWDGKAAIVYDDVNAANGLAATFETYAKHSDSKFPNAHWTTFSLVGVPSV